MVLQIGQAEENGYRWLMPVSLSILQVGLVGCETGRRGQPGAPANCGAARSDHAPKNVLPFARKRDERPRHQARYGGTSREAPGPNQPEERTAGYGENDWADKHVPGCSLITYQWPNRINRNLFNMIDIYARELGAYAVTDRWFRAWIPRF